MDGERPDTFLGGICGMLIAAGGTPITRLALNAMSEVADAGHPPALFDPLQIRAFLMAAPAT